MKLFLAHLRNTIISGIILLIPVFAIIMMLQSLYSKLTGVGHQLSSLLGLKAVAGVGPVAIATSLVLLFAFYICGLLVRFSMVTSVRNWLEETLLQHIPGYMGYKVKMEEKIMPRKEEKIAALVRVGEITRPGFLMSREGNECVVFIPNTPDTNTGEVWVVKADQVKELGKADVAFITSIRHSGKGLVISA